MRLKGFNHLNIFRYGIFIRIGYAYIDKEEKSIKGFLLLSFKIGYGSFVNKLAKGWQLSFSYPQLLGNHNEMETFKGFYREWRAKSFMEQYLKEQ